jgi:hypothetical protein
MKRLFLSSIASKVLNKLPELLDCKPSDLTVAFIANAADLYTDKWFVDDDKSKLIEL